jgi:hypothetical protein
MTSSDNTKNDMKDVTKGEVTDETTSIPAEVIAARPYIFADTRVRLLTRACWAAWVDGPGATLHSEYVFTMRKVVAGPRQAAMLRASRSDEFHWDGVILPKCFTSKPLCECYAVKNEKFKLRVQADLEGNISFFEYMKRDIANDIAVILEGDWHSAYRSNSYNMVYNDLLKYRLRVLVKGHEARFRKKKQSNRCFLDRKIEDPGSDLIEVYNHNIVSIIKFMMTSRLNVVDYLPQYTLDRLTPT